MKCSNCGAENSNNAIFCMDCGHNLKEDNDFDKTVKINDNYEYDDDKIVKNNSYKDSSMSFKQKGIIFGVVVIGLIAFSLIFNFGFSKYKISKLESSAAANLESKNYDIARQKYSELYEKTSDKKYLDAVNKIDADLEANENLIEANKRYEDKEYDLALEYLSNVESSDEEVNKKKDKLLEKINYGINSEISLLIGNKDYDNAINTVNSYLSYLPESEELKNLKKEITTEKSANEEKIKSEAKLQEQKARADELEVQIAKLKKQSAASLIGTYQYVTSSRANVRSGPGFSYGISYNLYKGNPVYVFDTKNADGRTWCNIGDGWISYRTLNGEAK